MIIQIFKNLADFKWFFAVIILLMMFLPFDFAENGQLQMNSLLEFTLGKKLFIISNTKVVAIISSFLLVIIASAFHSFLIRHRLIGNRNFAGLFYSIFFIVAWYPEIAQLNDIIAVFFLLLSLILLFESEGSINSLLRVFDGAFVLSIACLLNFWLFPYIILPFVALVLFRQFQWRIFAAALTGLLLPHFFLLSIQFLIFDKFLYLVFFNEFIASIQIDFVHFTKYPIHWFIFTPLLLFTFIRAMMILSERKILIRKKIVLLIWFTGIAMILLPFDTIPLRMILLLIALPFGNFVAATFRFVYEKKLFATLTDIAVLTVIILRFVL